MNISMEGESPLEPAAPAARHLSQRHGVRKDGEVDDC